MLISDKKIKNFRIGHNFIGNPTLTSPVRVCHMAIEPEQKGIKSELIILENLNVSAEIRVPNPPS